MSEQAEITQDPLEAANADPLDVAKAVSEKFEIPVDVLTEESIAEAGEELKGDRVAIFDVDGTIADSMITFESALNARFEELGISFRFNRKNNINFDVLKTIFAEFQGKIPEDLIDKLTSEICYEPFNRAEVFEEAPPIVEMVQLAQMLKAFGYKVIYATSRPPQTFEATAKWLQKFDLPIDHLYFEIKGKKYSTKKDLILALARKVAPGSIFVDDKPQTANEIDNALKELPQCNIKVFAPETTWNTALDINDQRKKFQDEYTPRMQYLLASAKDIGEYLVKHGFIADPEI